VVTAEQQDTCHHAAAQPKYTTAAASTDAVIHSQRSVLPREPAAGRFSQQHVHEPEPWYHTVQMQTLQPESSTVAHHLPAQQSSRVRNNAHFSFPSNHAALPLTCAMYAALLLAGPAVLCNRHTASSYFDQQLTPGYFPSCKQSPAGPVNIHDRVLRAMNVPGQNHRDPWFAAFFKDVLADSKYIFQTQAGTPFIFTGAQWLLLLCCGIAVGCVCAVGLKQRWYTCARIPCAHRTAVSAAARESLSSIVFAQPTKVAAAQPPSVLGGFLQAFAAGRWQQPQNISITHLVSATVLCHGEAIDNNSFTALFLQALALAVGRQH
jgi:hypothetical protein